jgi:hypothetical protein
MYWFHYASVGSTYKSEEDKQVNIKQNITESLSISFNPM